MTFDENRLESMLKKLGIEYSADHSGAYYFDLNIPETDVMLDYDEKYRLGFYHVENGYTANEPYEMIETTRDDTIERILRLVQSGDLVIGGDVPF